MPAPIYASVLLACAPQSNAFQGAEFSDTLGVARIVADVTMEGNGRREGLAAADAGATARRTHPAGSRKDRKGDQISIQIVRTDLVLVHSAFFSTSHKLEEKTLHL